MKKHGFRYCSVCKYKLKKRGKTVLGTQRWYCNYCKQSSVKKRLDLSRVFVFESFISWLLGKTAQSELGGSSRTFRSQIEWCWGVPIPNILTGEIHHTIIIDGILVNGHVCLIARTINYVVAWLWVDCENSTNWSKLLNLLPAPTYVVCDGQKGMLKAISNCWTPAIVQRCRFHIWLNVRSKLTLRPESRAGRDLLLLTRQLLKIHTKRQARKWKQNLAHWHKKHTKYINERTTKPNPKPRERSWRYTHERLRSAYRQLYKQTDNLLRSSYRLNPNLPSTTNHIEGGINSQLRSLLKLHRGMRNEHQMMLVNWYLYTRTECKKAPRFCL